MESLEIDEPAAAAGRVRQTTITLKLCSACHDGWIVFTYREVKSHSLTRYQCDQGSGKWLRDEFAVGDSGLIVHRITWVTTAGATSQWIIEAREVTYAWTLRETPSH